MSGGDELVQVIRGFYLRVGPDMNSLLTGRLGAFALLLVTLCPGSARGQNGECFGQFKSGREDFVLDVDDSVKEGATFLSSPKLDRYRDCLSACCKEPRCNVAFMETGESENSVKSCFLFDCLYKKQYVCHFVRKTGFKNYILDSVYEDYLAVDVPPGTSDHAPVANGGPDRVIQPHDTVTLNGIESKDDVGITSYNWQMLSGNPYAVIEKTNFKDQIIVSNLSSGMYKFQLTVTDTVGQSDSTKVTILVLTPDQSQHHCMAPKKVGPCRGSFPRWHYNAASERCEKFVFGGCKENLNNYLTEDECTNACSGSEKKGGSGRGLPISPPEEKCGVPCTPGQFTCANRCCLDPGLECDGSPQCSDGSDEHKCDELTDRFQVLLQIPVDEQKVRCTLSPDTGPCRESFTKWYYNPRIQDCFPFNYGSCQGNENRFDTKESCMSFCHGVTGEDQFVIGPQHERSTSDSHTGVIVIAALLGVAIAVVLGILVYCVMKGKKKSSQHSSVPASTTQFTSLEDREQKKPTEEPTDKSFAKDKSLREGRIWPFRSRGLSAMPEGSHSALHQGPMGEESPQLSSPLSPGQHDQENIDLSPDCYSQLCVEPLDGESDRPVSLVSTLSSGSSRDSHSLFGSTIALPSSTTPPIPSEEDIDLELSPTEGTGEQALDQSPTLTESRGHWQDRLRSLVINHQWNNNNSPSNRKASGEILHISTLPVISDTMAPNPKLSYVDRVVMEIIETERMYVKDLRSIVEDYLVHIIDMSNLPIRPEQVCALFGNIEDIYVFNSELLQSLDMCENDPVAIARCFVNKSDYFEIYTQYCTNYPNSVAALTDCMRSKTLGKFFRDRQAALKRSLPLGSYLLKPVQRILKYHLLLQEIAKHFDPDEDGYEVVQEAIDTMTGVAWYINDMKRKHEHAVRVQEIQSLLINWKGPDLTTFGELVLEGTFHVLRAKNTRTLFLFEKMLLITKKRGEHYVYKNHISCSTLMLLDSAKDPLLFSVIHFKHPKQPHTVQAKSVEEKRLWAQHIKRLILENHNTIVPQKAKDAVPVNSNYSGKYHYSPERLKKVESCQAADFHFGGRNERRRSEPVKQIMQSTKGLYLHADSEGALLGDRCSLQPATSVSTLASTLGEPQAERSLGEDPIPRRVSVEQLSPTVSQLKLDSPSSERRLEMEKAEEEEEGESFKEDLLIGNDQDDQNIDPTELKPTMKEEAETCRQQERCVDVALKNTPTTQVSVEEMCLLDCVFQAKSSDQLEHHFSQSFKSPVSPAQKEAPGCQDSSTETPEEKGGSDSSGPQVGETSVLTNGELSEEDEDELENKSILPSSVLDQASVIAQRFISSLSRQSSLVSEDFSSVTCPLLSTDNDAFKSLPACVDLDKQTQMSASSSPDPQMTSENICSSPAHEPTPDTLTEEERRSTLSKQDRLLIRKIRRYYEHAEHQDASFSVKRRESLSYIPAGLVSHLSRQLNSIPQDQAVPVCRKGLSRNRPTSWSVFDLPGLEKNQNSKITQNTELQSPQETHKDKSDNITDELSTEEEFRSSSEMVRVWQDMEMEEENPDVQQREKETFNESRVEVTQDINLDTLDVKTLKQLPLILGDSEISTASESSAITSPTSSPALEGKPKQDSQPSDSLLSQERNNVLNGQLPQITGFRTSVDEDQILQDMGKVKNKVFQLARQYSQRIKNNRPTVFQKNRETSNQQGFKNMPAVHEEKLQLRKKGKLNLKLSLNASNQAVINDVCSPSPAQTCSSEASAQSTLTSPQSPQPEPFHWPDVQELRSKYTEPARSKVTRSYTVPSRTFERSANMCNGCSLKYKSSSDLHKTLSDCTRIQSDAALKEMCPAVADWPQPRSQPQLQAQLCRWSSLDHVLGSLPLQEVQNLQEPGKTCCTTGKLEDGDTVFLEGDECAAKSVVPSSGKASESNVVKSLREKFQSLGTS
ncbi:hypothetical protein Q5P01_020423 [Channa striata]|uniref:Uncharacterized protein n=1 Tax=Channa striata TaxID=64152 RepID=A0AA88S3E9_CHASR|nr:hypothetical protein Q5P01_020423 [Channa striata]